jgi:hypothetical protein
MSQIIWLKKPIRNTEARLNRKRDFKIKKGPDPIGRIRMLNTFKC